MEYANIRVPVGLREKLRKRKIHPNQPYYEIIEDLLEEDKSGAEKGGSSE